MKCAIIDHSSKSTSKIATLFSDYSPIIIPFQEFSAKTVEHVDFVILSGGNIHISSPEDLIEEKEWLRTTNTPVLGICLGLEILAVANGATLHDLPQKIREFRTISIGTFRTSIFNSQMCFIKDPLEPFRILHKTKEIVDVIVHSNKPQLGLQGHPELSEGGEEIKEYFINNFVLNKSTLHHAI